MPAIIKVVDGRTIISVNGAQAAYLAAQAGIQKAVDDLGGTFKGDKGDTGPANNTYTDLTAFKAQPVTNEAATLVVDGVRTDYAKSPNDESANPLAVESTETPGVWWIPQPFTGKRVKLSWFYRGDWDDAIDLAYNYLKDTFGGGIIDISGQDVTISRPHLFLVETLLDGVMSTNSNVLYAKESDTLYIADGIDAFTFGQITPDRYVLGGGGIINCRVRGLGYVKGNISDIYGSSNESFGFRTLDTAQAGAKTADGTDNMTSRLAVFQAVDSPIQCHGNNVQGVGTAFVAERQYAYALRNNKVQWCTIGIHIAGLATTVTLRKNTIERCAIGVFTGYPASFLNIDDNVIEANYGGSDVFCINGPDTLRITRNYFEASPNNIVMKSDSSGTTVPFQVYIGENTGVDLDCRYTNIRDIIIDRNWINGIELSCFASGSLKNITLLDNYAGSGVDAFDVNDIVLNSVAQNYVHEIFCSNAKVAPQQATTEAIVSSRLALNQKPFVKYSVGSSSALILEVPNVSLNMAVKVTVLKYRVGMDWHNRIAEFVLGVRRVAGAATITDIVELSQTDLNVGATALPVIPSAPAIGVTGDVAAAQTITVTLGSAGPGGQTANHFIKAEYISTTSGIILR